MGDLEIFIKSSLFRAKRVKNVRKKTVYVNERVQVSTYRAKVGKIGELPCREKKYAQKN